jgi:hypothetical protein
MGHGIRAGQRDGPSTAPFAESLLRCGPSQRHRIQRLAARFEEKQRSRNHGSEFQSCPFHSEAYFRLDVPSMPCGLLSSKPGGPSRGFIPRLLLSTGGSRRCPGLENDRHTHFFHRKVCGKIRGRGAKMVGQTFPPAGHRAGCFSICRSRKPLDNTRIYPLTHLKNPQKKNIIIFPRSSWRSNRLDSFLPHWWALYYL